MTTPDQPTGMNELLENLYYAGAEADSVAVVGGGNNKKRAIAEAEAAIQQIVERCLGPDEDDNFSPLPGVGGFDIEKAAKNGLRAELRHNFQQAGLLRVDDV